MTDIIKVPFHGDSLDAVRDADGIWLSIPQACANIGVLEHGQVAKLKNKAWARVQLICTPDGRGYNQQTWCLRLDCVAMWLATIETSRVAESLRPKLERYQIECARVLNEHFFGKPAAAPDPRKLEGAGDLRDNRTLAGQCKLMTVREIATKAGADAERLWSRLTMGWSLGRALSQPVRSQRARQSK